MHAWCMTRTPPKTKTAFLLNPLDKPNERPTDKITVPAGNAIILYLSTYCLDNREYGNPFITVSFNEAFKIDFEVPYERLDFGKRLHRQGANSAACRLDLVLKKGSADHPLLIPIVVTTPKTIGSYDLLVTFSSDDIRGRTEEKLKLDVSETNFSHAKRFFQKDQFGVW